MAPSAGRSCCPPTVESPGACRKSCRLRSPWLGRLPDLFVLRGGRCVSRRQQRRWQVVETEHGNRRHRRVAFGIVPVGDDLRGGRWESGHRREFESAAAFEVVTSDGGEQWVPSSMPTGSGTVNTVSCSTTACVAVGSAHGGAALPVLSTTSGSSWTPDTALSASGSAFSGLSCYASTNCVFVGLNGNQPVSVSTGGGNPVPVTAQVRAQKDEVRR